MEGDQHNQNGWLGKRYEIEVMVNVFGGTGGIGTMYTKTINVDSIRIREN